MSPRAPATERERGAQGSQGSPVREGQPPHPSRLLRPRVWHGAASLSSLYACRAAGPTTAAPAVSVAAAVGGGQCPPPPLLPRRPLQLRGQHPATGPPPPYSPLSRAPARPARSTTPMPGRPLLDRLQKGSAEPPGHPGKMPAPVVQHQRSSPAPRMENLVLLLLAEDDDGAIILACRGGHLQVRAPRPRPGKLSKVLAPAPGLTCRTGHSAREPRLIPGAVPEHVNNDPVLDLVPGRAWPVGAFNTRTIAIALAPFCVRNGSGERSPAAVPAVDLPVDQRRHGAKTTRQQLRRGRRPAGVVTGATARRRFSLVTAPAPVPPGPAAGPLAPRPVGQQAPGRAAAGRCRRQGGRLFGPSSAALRLRRPEVVLCRGQLIPALLSCLPRALPTCAACGDMMHLGRPRPCSSILDELAPPSCPCLTSRRTAAAGSARSATRTLCVSSPVHAAGGSLRRPRAQLLLSLPRPCSSP